jgi:DNA polymerase V
LKDFSAAFEELLVVLKKVFEEIYVPGVLISGVHIFAFPLRSASHKQLHLFHEADEKSGALKALRQKVNARFGPFTLRSAATAFVPEVFRDVTSNVEITDIEGKALF